MIEIKISENSTLKQVNEFKKYLKDLGFLNIIFSIDAGWFSIYNIIDPGFHSSFGNISLNKLSNYKNIDIECIWYNTPNLDDFLYYNFEKEYFYFNYDRGYAKPITEFLYKK